MKWKWKNIWIVKWKWKLDQHLVTASSVTKCIETFKTDRLFRTNFVTDYSVQKLLKEIWEQN
jgi:hypothetical protein